MLNPSFCRKCIKFRKSYHSWRWLRRKCSSVSLMENNNEDIRINKANIQMLSPQLHKQIFRGQENRYDKETLKNVEEHLKSQNLFDKNSSITNNINFELPQIIGENLSEHFESIGNEQSKRYIELAEELANTLIKLPEKPKKWLFKPGWTKYLKNGMHVSVDQPDDGVMVYDVEVCMNAGNVPIIAVAASKTSWYCWVSEYLTDSSKEIPNDITPADLIVFQSKDAQRLLVGHNVAFDRTYLSGQYQLQCDKARFLDTLSMHMCVSGVTNEQRNYLNSKKHILLYDWMEVGTTNSLAKVYEFYCGKTLDKSIRDLFVEGDLNDIRNSFQDCVNYCANDVSCTHEVFCILWPMFREHLPHPVSFAGMLEMGTSYLPIDTSWKKYIEKSESMFDNVTAELKEYLMNIAKDTLSLIPGKRFEDDPWLWNLDWSIHKTVTKGIDDTVIVESDNFDDHLNKITSHLSEKRKHQLHLPGYPKWYRDLCMRTADSNYKPGPCSISSQTRVTPSLLRMTWDGYPLHYEQKHGWGYLKPYHDVNRQSDSNSTISKKNFPYENFMKELQGADKLNREKENDGSLSNLMAAIYDDTPENCKAIDIGVENVRFHKLPHKNGEGFNVGNPLAKDFLNKIEDGTLSAMGGFNAKRIIELNKMLAFWRNGRKRIMSQSTVWLDEPPEEESIKHGVILPQVITAGTVTRRAVEPTWLTASNPRSDRIGSELKSLVRAPPSYCLVGADVDSQELWIASLLGDAYFAQMHGSTALSWMTLQGKKQDGTDLHSRTAATIGMDRDEAKIFNYGRIYGAGEKFTVRLLMQFNHKLSESEAEKIASKLYKQTKGLKDFVLTKQGISLADKLGVNYSSNGAITANSLKRILYALKLTWRRKSKVVNINKEWHGGSESAMFNQLESIALSDEPRTPVLGCLITKALQPKYVHNHYKTSRVNWVVQSSAVDYLHLLLSCMKWLCDEYQIDARFCVSIHDEVRYIVHENDKYRAALALQISNLLTRSLFAYQLDMYDLPQSVAFFSAIDIDKVLRKEVDMDCVTPSNPHGLENEYGILPGESLDISKILEKTAGGKLSK